MIKYEWRDGLNSEEAAQLEDLLERAAAYDAEPEYSTIAFADVEKSMNQPSTARHLVIWMLAHATAMDLPDEAECIAGLIRLTFGAEHAAEATVVIDPRLRSIGIVTLFLEQVGFDADGPDGWLGSGAQHLTSWARGNHPATGRISNRFLIPRTRRVWKLIRPTDMVEEPAAAPVLEPALTGSIDELAWAASLRHHENIAVLREGARIVGAVALSLAPSESLEFGSCATIDRVAFAPNCDGRNRRDLLDGAAAIAQEAGLAGVIAYVESDDAALVNACRLTGFQHDRTDVRYELGGR